MWKEETNKKGNSFFDFKRQTADTIFWWSRVEETRLMSIRPARILYSLPEWNSALAAQFRFPIRFNFEFWKSNRYEIQVVHKLWTQFSYICTHFPSPSPYRNIKFLPGDIIRPISPPLYSFESKCFNTTIIQKETALLPVIYLLTATLSSRR